MKKIVCILICLAFLTGIFSACNDNEDVTDPDEALTEETTSVGFLCNIHTTLLKTTTTLLKLKNTC